MIKFQVQRFLYNRVLKCLILWSEMMFPLCIAEEKRNIVKYNSLLFAREAYFNN